MLFQAFCTLLSLTAVWLAGSLSHWAWFFMLSASVANALLYFQIERYGHMFLDFFYALLAMIGFSVWDGGGLKTRYLNRKQYVFLICITIGSAILSCFLLRKIGSQDVFWDSLSLITGVIGMALMIGKYVDQWYIWILHDLFNFCLSLRANLWLIALKQICYLLFATRGYYLWHLKAGCSSLDATA